MRRGLWRERAGRSRRHATSTGSTNSKQLITYGSDGCCKRCPIACHDTCAATHRYRFAESAANLFRGNTFEQGYSKCAKSGRVSDVSLTYDPVSSGIANRFAERNVYDYPARSAAPAPTGIRRVAPNRYPSSPYPRSHVCGLGTSDLTSPT